MHQCNTLQHCADCKCYFLTAGKILNMAQLLPNVYSSGTIGPCPDNAQVCRTLSCPKSCSGNGACYDGRCTCKLGYSGVDCSLSMITNTTTPQDSGNDGSDEDGSGSQTVLRWTQVIEVRVGHCLFVQYVTNFWHLDCSYQGN